MRENPKRAAVSKILKPAIALCSKWLSTVIVSFDPVACIAAT